MYYFRHIIFLLLQNPYYHIFFTYEYFEKLKIDLFMEYLNDYSLTL